MSEIFPVGSFSSEIGAKGWWNKTTFVYADGEQQRAHEFREKRAHEMGLRDPEFVVKSTEWFQGRFVEDNLQKCYELENYLTILDTSSGLGYFAKEYVVKMGIQRSFLEENALTLHCILFYKIYQEWVDATVKFMDPDSLRVRFPYNAMRSVLGDLTQYTTESRKTLLSLYADVLGSYVVPTKKQADALCAIAAVLPKAEMHIHPD